VTGGLRVEAFRSLAAAAHLAAAVEALNLASRRPSPFLTLSYAETFLAHDEFALPGTEPLFLAAFHGEELAGFLALRRRRQRAVGWSSVKIEALVTHDIDRPAIVTRPQDEAACAEAFWRHIVEQERDWTFVEIQEQELDSPLVPPPSLGPRFWVRRFENNPNATIHLDYPDGAAYFRSLSNNQRRAIRHSTNRLFRGGEVEIVSSDDPLLQPALLDLYLDVETRSWKADTDAALSRHPVRLEFFRALARGRASPSLWFRFLLLDGFPIAAELNAHYADTEYGLEVVYDEDHRALAPATLLFFVSVAEAISAGAKHFNLMNNFAWQKERWGATIRDLAAIQVFRKGSLSSVKARLGDLRRRLVRPGPSQRHATVNLSKPEREERPARPPSEEARRRAADRLAALERSGALRRLRGAALRALLPFDPVAGDGSEKGSPPRRSRRGDAAGSGV